MALFDLTSTPEHDVEISHPSVGVIATWTSDQAREAAFRVAACAAIAEAEERVQLVAVDLNADPDKTGREFYAGLPSGFGVDGGRTLIDAAGRLELELAGHGRFNVYLDRRLFAKWDAM